LQYIANPFLVNGYKFDMRIYVLVRCCDPLRVFIHEEVRLQAVGCYFVVSRALLVQVALSQAT